MAEEKKEVPELSEEERIQLAEERYRRMMQSVETHQPEAGGNGLADKQSENGSELVVLPEIETMELRAVRAYARLGSFAAVSRELGISAYELGKMAGTQEWQQELLAIRREDSATLDARLTKILGTTLAHIEDRLANGEKSYVGGKLVIEPVPAIVLVKLAEVVFEQRQIVRELPTSYNSESNKLSELAAKLEELGKAQQMRTIDQEEIDAKKA